MSSHFKFAFRSLLKSPGFTVVAVLMLALGIGLSSSSFSLANVLLLRNVPYPEPTRLVRLYITSPQTNQGSFSPGNALSLRAATTVEKLATFAGDALSLGEPGQPAEQVSGMTVTANFFELMGVHASLGRVFSEGEDAPDKPRVAILTQRSWVRRYAADPAVIGRTVRLNSETYTVIGVLPASFDAPLLWGSVDYIIPQIMQPGFATNFKDSWLGVATRLKPSVSLAQAQSELSTLAATLAREHPKENPGIGVRITTLYDSNMDNMSRILLWLMTGISLALLLIACANLASLQIARAFGRSREFAIRAALGGNRKHLMTPLLVESLVLAFAGGVVGLLVASWSNNVVGHFLRINGEPGFPIPIDNHVLAFAVFASVLSGIAFGLAPAWLASRAPAAEALKEGSRGSTGGRSHQRLKSTLIVVELALALTLTGAASSFGVGVRSFMKRQVGWEINGLFTGYLALPYNQYHDDTRNRTFQRALMEKLRAIPGADHATISTGVPVFYLGGPTALTIEGAPPVEHGREPLTQSASVTGDYFAALKIPLKSGSFFNPGITEKDPDVAVINETFAQRFWPGGNAIGHRVRLGDSDKWIEIIGVIGDLKLLGRMDRPETPLQLFRPLMQAPNRYLTLTLRTTLAPEALTKSVRAAVASIDPDLPVAQPGSLRADVDRNLSNINIVIIQLGVSAFMGLGIAAIGLFGVISQLTQQRTRDIGVRVALGAQSRDILQLVLGGAIKLLAIGLLIGIPGFFFLNRLLNSAMPEMALPGAWLLGVNLAVLSGAMILACYLPARRAARINPVDALRTE